MNIFTEHGWLDIAGIERSAPGANFFFILGARQTGKTYGILNYWHEMQRKYVFMRLTQREMKFTCNSKINMYKEMAFPWADHMSIGDGSPTYIYDDEVSENEPVAMAIALSDVAKIRGFGAKRYTHIVLDEFIPETTAIKRDGLGFAFKNAYTTINSNRDTPAGGNKPPVKAWLLANSNDLTSDILSAFNVTSKVLAMMKAHQNYSYMPDRGICIVLVDNSPVSAQMQKAALAKAIGCQDDFTRMAYNNIFVNDDSTGVMSRPLTEYREICSVDDLTFMQHKSRNEWYIVEGYKNCRVHYVSKNPTHYTAFKRAWAWQGLITPVDGKNIFYNCYTAKIKAYKILNLS